MSLKKLILAATVSVLFTSCASIRTDTSNPSLQSPMTTKPGGTAFHAELGSSDRIKFTDDAGDRPPNINLVHSRSNDVRLNMAYGITERFDFSAGVTSTAGLNLTSRYRMIGDDKSTWTTAGTLFVNYDTSEKSGDTNGAFGVSGYPWNSKATSTLGAVGLAIGYRVSENLLLILNGGIGQTMSKMSISQDPANGDPGGNYSSEVKAPLQNAGFGFAFGHDTLVTLGAMYTHKEWKDSTLGDTSTTHAILKIETH